MVSRASATALLKATPATDLSLITSGPKFFPRNWCETSSIDDQSSQEEMAMPGAEEPEEVMDDKVFEAMMEDFDQDALEAAPKEAEPKEPEQIVEGSEEAPDMGHEEEEAEEEFEPPAVEGGGRRDLKAQATSLRHLLTHLPKNPHCVSCQQAKMRQRYSHKGAFTREFDQLLEKSSLVIM